MLRGSSVGSCRERASSCSARRLRRSPEPRVACAFPRHTCGQGCRLIGFRWSPCFCRRHCQARARGCQGCCLCRRGWRALRCGRLAGRCAHLLTTKQDSHSQMGPARCGLPETSQRWSLGRTLTKGEPWWSLSEALAPDASRGMWHPMPREAFATDA